MNRKLKLEELNRIDLASFKDIDKVPCILVLDNIRSHHNVGALFRTADAFKIEKIILFGITPKPPHREIHKTALGATETVDWEYIETEDQLISKLKLTGYSVHSLEQTTNSVGFDAIKTGDKMILIVGNEVEGVSDQLIRISDSCIEIPQEGTKHSLNVAVAGGIALWEIYKKLK